MSWKRLIERFKIGDEVRFNRGWLQGQANLASSVARGVITGIEEKDGMRYASVEWDRPGVPELVNVANLAIAHPRSRA